MLSVAGLRPLAPPAESIVRAREETDALPTAKYVVLPFAPASFPEDGCGVHPQPRFQSPTRVAGFTAEAEMSAACVMSEENDD
jgi:hypothetical protein